MYHTKNTLNFHTVSIESSVALAKDGDQNKNGQLDGGDTVSITFRLTNRSKAEAKDLTLNTGTPKSLLYFLRNFKGVNGATYEHDMIIFKNVVILPKQTQTISLDASLVYNTNQDSELELNPSLVNASNQSIATGDSVTASIKKVSAKDIPTMTTTKEGN